MTVLDAWRRRADRHADRADADGLRWAWRQACEGAGLSRTVQTVTGPTVSTPKVDRVEPGPPVVLVVRLLAGQVPDDVRAVAWRLAGALGARMLRVSPRGLSHVRVELLTVDPLAAVVELPPGNDACARGLLLAVDDTGAQVRAELAELPHVVVQGQTRSGKSAWTYALLVQAVEAGALVAGVDASGLLLRPFAGSEHAGWQACGLADPDRVEDVLTRLVAKMDARIGAIPADRDTVDDDARLVLVVLEEWPGVLRALDAHDAKAGKRARVLVARLLAESHKARMRVVLIAQRADAQIVGGSERAQCGARLSFRVDNADAVRLLHPDADAGLVQEHATAPPGVALLALAGDHLRRVRAPWIGGYGAYARRVTAGVSGV